MKLTITLTALALALTPLAATAQTTQKFTAARHNEYGLTYSLPRTHLRVAVEAERTVRKAGPYYKYAKKYLGTTDVITEDSQSWDVKSVELSSFGRADNSEQYLMQFKSNTSVYCMKSEDGRLLSVNTESVDDPAVDRKGQPASPTALDDNNFLKSLPGELLVSESTAKRAEIAAQMIYKIRESRTNFATGEADQMPPDGEALKLVMEQLDAQEATLTALFVGAESKSTCVRVYDYIPDTVETAATILARVSDFDGLVPPDDLSGAPLYISMKILERGELPRDDKGVEKKLPKGAVIYKMPGKAEFTLRYEGRVMARATFAVAQLGCNFGLEPALFSDKKAPSFLRLYPATGAIQDIGAAQPAAEK